MTIEEKAEELSGMSEHNYNTIAESNAAYNAALEAMEWVLNKVYKWLEEHANESCIDVIVNESMITAVYNTPLKIDMNDLLDDLAMIKSIALVISKKAELENERIIVKIGACYDKLSMSIVESENAHKQYLWRGNVIDKAYKLSENAQDGSILINKLIWNNITDANQKLFELNSKFEEVYEGRIGNIVMNNWLISK